MNWNLSYKIYYIIVQIRKFYERQTVISPLPINFNMFFGCPKEPSEFKRDGSFEYKQHMYWMKNEENSFPIRTLIWRPDYMFDWLEHDMCNTHQKRYHCTNTNWAKLFNRTADTAICHGKTFWKWQCWHLEISVLKNVMVCKLSMKVTLCCPSSEPETSFSVISFQFLPFSMVPHGNLMLCQIYHTLETLLYKWGMP